jgi:hypothetical protein
MTILEELLRFRKSYWVKNGYCYSSYAMALNFSESVWFPIVLPILATFPALSIFIEEWLDGKYYMTSYRYGNRFKYSLIKSIASNILSTLAVILGVFLYFGIVSIVFPSFKEYSTVLENDTFYYKIEYYNYIGDQTRPLGRILTLLVKVLSCSLVGTIFPIVSIVLYILLKDRFLALSIPMIANYVSYKVSSNIPSDVEKPYILLLLPYSQCKILLYIHAYFESILYVWYFVGLIALYWITLAILNALVLRRYVYND